MHQQLCGDTKLRVITSGGTPTEKVENHCFRRLIAGLIRYGIRGRVVSWGTMLQAGRSRVLRISIKSLDFSFGNSYILTLAMRSIWLMTEMSTRNLFGGKELPTCKADNLIAICEPIV
jgi:hypothetical protein